MRSIFPAKEKPEVYVSNRRWVHADRPLFEYKLPNDERGHPEIRLIG